MCVCVHIMYMLGSARHCKSPQRMTIWFSRGLPLTISWDSYWKGGRVQCICGYACMCIFKCIYIYIHTQVVKFVMLKIQKHRVLVKVQWNERNIKWGTKNPLTYNSLIYPKQQGSHCSLLKCHLSTWICQFEWTFRCPCRGRWAVSWWPTWGPDELSGAWPGRRTGVSGTRLSKILPLFLQHNWCFSLLGTKIF